VDALRVGSPQQTLWQVLSTYGWRHGILTLALLRLGIFLHLNPSQNFVPLHGLSSTEIRGFCLIKYSDPPTCVEANVDFYNIPAKCSATLTQQTFFCP
jgi:hypothetical protein